jgi:2-aminoadipate transaminase
MNLQFSEALMDLRGSATREIWGKAKRPGMISLGGGSPARESLPMKQLEEIAAEIFSDYALMNRGYNYSPTEGFDELREQVLELAKTFGIDLPDLSISNVIITTGGGQAIDLTLRAFVNRGDSVLVENPTYLGFLQVAQSYGARLTGVDAGENGLILADLEEKMIRHKPKLLYVVPTFSNPTGKTYTMENRRAIVELAKKHNVIIMEDDPYSRLRISGNAVPPLKSFDRENDCVVYISSFSKVISPGIRLGYAIGREEIIRKMTIAKQGADLSSSNISQLLVLRYLEKGLYYPVVRQAIPLYRERKNAMINAIKKYFPDEFSHTDPEGGLFIWGEFKTPINTAAMFDEAINRNVAYVQGQAFYADGSGLNTIRLNFSNENPETIERAVKILGNLSKETIAAFHSETAAVKNSAAS